MQAIEVAFNDGAAALMPQYVQQFQPNHPVGSVERFPALNYLQISVLNPGYVPKMVFIDRTGMIRLQHAGEDGFFQDELQDKNIRGVLDEMLKAPAPQAKKTRTAKKKS